MLISRSSHPRTRWSFNNSLRMKPRRQEYSKVSFPFWPKPLCTLDLEGSALFNALSFVGFRRRICDHVRMIGRTDFCRNHHFNMEKRNDPSIARWFYWSLCTAVHVLTNTCWKKCVTGTIRNGKLEKAEENCTQNCVDRFFDANILVIKQLEMLKDK